MKDEIKEILDNLKYTADNTIFVVAVNQEELDRVSKSVCKYLSINNRQAKTLLDYITNLQEQLHQASLDIQELTEKDIGCPSWCDKLTNLQEENKILKENAIHNDKVVDKAKWNEMIYKSRNEKAIEYIKGLCYIESKNEWFTYGDDLSPEHIVNILQGDDKND